MSDVSIRMALVDEVSPGMQNIVNASRTAASQLTNVGREIDRTFRSNAPTAFASRAGGAMNSVRSQAANLGNAIDGALDGFSDFSAGDIGAVESAFSSAAAGADELSGSASRAADSVSQVADSMGEYQDANGRWHDANGRFISQSGEAARASEEFADSTDEAGESMDRASSKAINFGSALKTLFAVVSAAKIAGDIKDFAASSVNIGKDFTSMISEVQAISGASTAEIAQMEETARAYGATTVFSATEAAEALKYMSLAGWDANQSSMAIGGVLNLAAASGMGLGQSSDMVTDYLSAFGMNADQSDYFADMLAHAQSSSNTTAAQLGEAYRNSAANLHAAGQDVETTTSLLEAMANQGFKGSESGTALAATMRDITQKMEKGAIKIGETSIAVQDSSGNFRDLTDILIEVESATGDMGDAERAAALGSTFTSDSIKALNMILTEGMGKVSGYEEALRHSGGTAEEMAGIMNDNLTGDMANMNSAFEEMKLQVFEGMEGPLREGAQYITSSVIPALTEWVPEVFGTIAEGVSQLGKELKPLIETVLKNPGAVANAFASIGSGFLAMKAVNTGLSAAKKVSEAGGIVQALKNFGSTLFGSPWAAGAAAVVGAITAIGIAAREYSKMQVEDNLKSHFGEFALTSEQAKELAGQIIPVGVTAQLETAGAGFEKSEELVAEAEELLAQNGYINWKVNSIGFDLTEADASTLLQNTEQFISNVEEALEREEYSAELAVKALLGEVDSAGLVGQMQSWLQEDKAMVDTLGSAITELLQQSINDGVYDINTQTAIEIMQAKMLDIINGGKMAELEAQKDWLGITASGAALTPESWTETVGYMDEYRQNRKEADKDAYMQLLTYYEQAKHNGHIDEKEMNEIKSALGKAVHEQDSTALASEWEWLSGSMAEAYGTELSAVQKAMGSSGFKDKIKGIDPQGGLTFAKTDLEVAMQEEFAGFDVGTRGALADRYETMLPTIQEMDAIISEAVRTGQAVPEALMDSYREAMTMGAASGNTEAMWQYMANEVAQDFPGMGEFVSTLEANGLAFSEFPEEVQNCFEKAFVKTNSTEDFSGMLTELVSSAAEGGEVDMSAVEAIFNKYGLSIGKYIQETGIEADADGAVKIKASEIDISEVVKTLDGLEATGNTKKIGEDIYAEYEVKSGDSLWNIASQLTENASQIPQIIEQIASASGIKDPSRINTGEMIFVPSEFVLEEGAAEKASEAGKQAEEEIKSVAGGDMEVEKVTTVNETYVPGEKDDSGITSAAGEELSPAVAEQEITVNQKYVKGESDTSQVTEGADAALKQQTVEATATANVISEMGTDNFDSTAGSFAEKFQNALRSAFSRTFTATTTASITVDYKIANPTKTITFSGGGSGTATVEAHASGGYFTSPHYGLVAEAGPEYIIPDDGSANAASLWQQAGKSLGLLDGDAPIQVAPSMPGGNGSSGETERSGGSRTVDININGNGKITAGGGLSKEDIVDVLIERVRDVFVGIVEQEALIGGDESYAY